MASLSGNCFRDSSFLVTACSAIFSEIACRTLTFVNTLDPCWSAALTEYPILNVRRISSCDQTSGFQAADPAPFVAQLQCERTGPGYSGPFGPRLCRRVRPKSGQTRPVLAWWIFQIEKGLMVLLIFEYFHLNSHFHFRIQMYDCLKSKRTFALRRSLFEAGNRHLKRAKSGHLPFIIGNKRQANVRFPKPTNPC